MNERKVDKVLLFIVLILVFGGFFLFISASLGLLAREGADFLSVAMKQSVGIFIGILALIGFSKLKYNFWKKYAVLFFIGSAILTALVFIPFLGFSHGGATRWLNIGIFTFQPAEFLKLGVVIYLAAWFATVKGKIKTFKWGVAPLLIVLTIAGGILVLQPDMGTFFIVIVTAFSLFLISGGKWRHMFGIILIFIALLTVIIFSKPYIIERFTTFIDPSRDLSGAGWQLNQSLIAIGSGGIFGKGFGQSIQKFNFLPEPIGDSIFAVAAEEFGFLGALFIIAIFIAFLSRGLQLSRHAPDTFSGLLVAGIVIMIVLQSLINIASMLGVFPLTGIPLLFISHGASALIVALMEVGILLNISKYRRHK